MALSDESTDYISDSEAIETVIEYDLEVEGSPHSSDEDQTQTKLKQRKFTLTSP